MADDESVESAGYAGEYQLLDRVGRGMSGEVFRARDPLTGGEVAVKRLIEADPAHKSLERFAREVALLSRLPHPALMPVLDADLEADPPYVVLPWMAGGDMSVVLEQGRALPGATVARVGARLAAALAHLHEHGVLHRDLKPANVLRDADGLAYLADLGLGAEGGRSGLTATGFVVGTPLYLAPEVRAGRDHGQASDQYSLARVLLELGLGRRLAMEELGNPGALAGELEDVALRKVLRRALRSEPDQRFSDAHELAEELTLVAAGAVSEDRVEGADPAPEETATLTGGTLARAEPPGFPPSLKDRYAPERLLGAGGMGAVYLAQDRKLGRSVAVKLLAGRAGPGAQERFVQEARALSAVRSPHVLDIFDFGVAQGVPYLVSERLEGADLRALPAGSDAMEVMLQAAEGLQAAHDAGLCHRDVKPANLFRTRGGRVVVLDFGLALGDSSRRLTRTGAVVGTPRYMAPERFRGSASGPAGDWFGWGATLFELLEGRPAVRDQDLGELARGTLRLPPATTRTPADSGPGRVLAACLQGDPRDRPCDLGALRGLIEADHSPPEVRESVEADRPARRKRSAAEPRPATVSPRPSARSRLGRGAGVLALLGVCLVLGWLAAPGLEPEPKPGSSAAAPDATTASAGPPTSGLPGDLRERLAREAGRVAEAVSSGLPDPPRPARGELVAWVISGGRPEQLPAADREVLDGYAARASRPGYPEPLGPFVEVPDRSLLEDYPRSFFFFGETHPWLRAGMGASLEGWHAAALRALDDVYQEDRRLQELAESNRLDTPTGGVFVNQLLKRRSSWTGAADYAMVRPGGPEAIRGWVGEGRRAYRRFLWCAARALEGGDPRGLEGLYLKAAEWRPNLLLPDAFATPVDELLGRRLEAGPGAALRAVLTSRLQEVRARFDLARGLEAEEEVARWRELLAAGVRAELAPLAPYGLGRLLVAHRRRGDRASAAQDLARFEAEAPGAAPTTRRDLEAIRRWLAGADDERTAGTGLPDLPPLPRPPRPPPRPYLPDGPPPTGAPGPPPPPRLGERLLAELLEVVDGDLDHDNVPVPAGEGTPFRQAFQERGWPAYSRLPMLQAALAWIQEGGEPGTLPREEQLALRRYDREAEALGLLRPLGPALEPGERTALERFPVGFGFVFETYPEQYRDLRFAPPLEGWGATATRALGAALLALETAREEVRGKEWRLDYSSYSPYFASSIVGEEENFKGLLELAIDTGAVEELRSRLGRIHRELRRGLHALGRAAREPGGRFPRELIATYVSLTYLLLPDLVGAPLEVLLGGPVPDSLLYLAVHIEWSQRARASRTGRQVAATPLSRRRRLWRRALAYEAAHGYPRNLARVLQFVVSLARREGEFDFIEEVVETYGERAEEHLEEDERAAIQRSRQARDEAGGSPAR